MKVLRGSDCVFSREQQIYLSYFQFIPFHHKIFRCWYKVMKFPLIWWIRTTVAAPRTTYLYLAAMRCKSRRRVRPAICKASYNCYCIDPRLRVSFNTLPLSSLNSSGLHGFNLYSAKAQMLSMKVASHGLAFPNDEAERSPKLKGMAASGLYFKFPVQSFNQFLGVFFFLPSLTNSRSQPAYGQICHCSLCNSESSAGFVCLRVHRRLRSNDERIP